MKIALFPGSFDPITLGHVDVLNRALPLFDKIIVGIGTNATKNNMFPVEQREKWIVQTFQNIDKVEVATYKGLTVDFCKEIGAQYILRGLRDTKDFEFERSISQMNYALNSKIETVFLITDPRLSAINASIVRDIIKHGGNIEKFVPVCVASDLNNNH